MNDVSLIEIIQHVTDLAVSGVQYIVTMDLQSAMRNLNVAIIWDNAAKKTNLKMILQKSKLDL